MNQEASDPFEFIQRGWPAAKLNVMDIVGDSG